ncbi:MAG: hypothetical protein ACPLPT_09615, partial [Moorellales bacterium]
MNCIFNHNFQQPPNSVGRWPPGWTKVGGNTDTSWRRVTEYAQDGRYCLRIDNPTYEGFCGVREAPPQPVPVRPGEKWYLSAAVRLENPGWVQLAVTFLDARDQGVGRAEQQFAVSGEMQEVRLEYLIPPGAVRSVAEVGLVGPNRLWIDRVERERLEAAPAERRGQAVPHTGETQETTALTGPPEGRAVPGRAADAHFVALIGADGPLPRLRFGRQLTVLPAGKREAITLLPLPQRRVRFFELYLKCTRPVRVEICPPQGREEHLDLGLPSGEFLLYLSEPLTVGPG